MNEQVDPEDALSAANAILLALHDTKTDPVIGYAALGHAFIHLHRALGRGEKSWLETTKEMAELTKWDEK